MKFPEEDPFVKESPASVEVCTTCKVVPTVSAADEDTFVAESAAKVEVWAAVIYPVKDSLVPEAFV